MSDKFTDSPAKDIHDRLDKVQIVGVPQRRVRSPLRRARGNRLLYIRVAGFTAKRLCAAFEDSKHQRSASSLPFNPQI